MRLVLESDSCMVLDDSVNACVKLVCELAGSHVDNQPKHAMNEKIGA